MKTLLSILVFLAWGCPGQGTFVLNSGVLVSANYIWSPTNIIGYPALAWFVADDIFTNASTLILPDRVGGKNLTNRAAASTWPTNSLLNGHMYLGFDGVDDYLFAKGYTNIGWNSIVMVLRLNNPSGTKAYYGGYSSAESLELEAASNKRDFPNEYNYANVTITNTWYVRYDYFTTNSYLGLTNNVTCGSGDFGPRANLRSFNLARNDDFGSFFGPISVAEIIMYGTNLPAFERTRVYNYLKSKYGL